MYVKLPESARNRKRSFGGTLLSTLVHAVVVGGTVVATGAEVQRQREPETPSRVVYVAPPPDRVTAARPPESSTPRIPTNLEPVVPAVPRTIDLSVVPPSLPATTSTIGTISEALFRRVPRDSTPVGPAMPPSDQPLTETMVERVVQPLGGNPVPRYPSLLANTGIEGVVYAQFVVDTMGRVEPASIRFPKSDHVLFERAVRDVLVRSRYRPAEVGEHRVRQLVEQAFSFALKR